MPVLASTFYIAKNYRRFRYAIQSTVPAATSTWTDSTYRYVKWAAGTGSLVVHELPMDGVAEIECQIVAGGGGGGGSFESYNMFAFWLPTGGGGGGAGGCYFGTVNVTELGSIPVTVGTGGEGQPLHIVAVGIGNWPGSMPNGTSGTNSSFGSASSLSPGIGGNGASTYLEYIGGSFYSQYSYNYVHYAGRGGGSDLIVVGETPPTYPAPGVSLPDGGDGAQSHSISGRPSTLWDGSAYGIGGAGGASGYPLVPNGSAAVPAGYGNGGSGAKGHYDPQQYSAATFTDPADGAGRDGTGGVVIIRWPLAFEGAS